MRMLTALLVVEILLPRHWPTNFRGLPYHEEMALSWLKHMDFVLFEFHEETNAFCNLLKVKQLIIVLCRYIWKNQWIICVVRISSFYYSGGIRCLLILTLSFVIYIVCSERRNLPPGSKCVRLCLVCQAVKNKFTSGSRSYSVPISSLTRRNLARI